MAQQGLVPAAGVRFEAEHLFLMKHYEWEGCQAKMRSRVVCSLCLAEAKAC